MIRFVSDHRRDLSTVFATCGEVMMRRGYRFCLCLSAGLFTKLNEISNTHSPEKMNKSLSVCVLVLIRAVSREDVCVQYSCMCVPVQCWALEG